MSFIFFRTISNDLLDEFCFTSQDWKYLDGLTITRRASGKPYHLDKVSCSSPCNPNYKIYVMERHSFQFPFPFYFLLAVEDVLQQIGGWPYFWRLVAKHISNDSWFAYSYQERDGSKVTSETYGPQKEVTP